MIFKNKVSNSGKEATDSRRDSWIRSEGYTVKRIKNEELERNRNETVVRLREILLKRLDV
jgi:very-short-patch-repair endonuclease